MYGISTLNDPTTVLNYFSKAVDTSYSNCMGQVSVRISRKSREIGGNPSVDMFPENQEYAERSPFGKRVETNARDTHKMS